VRDIIQERVGYATTNADMTDTILGKGMASNGALCHEIPARSKGVCYIVNEKSRVPVKARTYWVPDEDVSRIAQETAHLRVQLDSMDPSKDEPDLDDDGSGGAELPPDLFTD
jgi:hypothetical protein